MAKKAIVPSTLADDALMDLSGLKAATCMEKSFLYNEMAKGRLARPLKLSPRAARWRVSDVRRYLQTLRGEAE